MLRRVIGKDWIVGPGVAELREHRKLGRSITRSGHDMHVWTVNTKNDLDLCLELGVKAVISDRPAYMKELLAK
jgi:glycerophosphoryl diester phosphodiesterase